MGLKRDKSIVIIISIALAGATFIAYQHLRINDFVSFDDFVYVTENPNVSGGINLESISWAFTGNHVGNWHPLTSISHMLDCQLFGLNPTWHHLNSLLLHIANVLLLFWLLRRLTGALWASAFVAAVFAIHPLNVESVAWIAERKNVLSTLFGLLTIAAYSRYANNPSMRRYLLVLFTFCLGLMAKPMLVTLPLVLLLLDFWPLKRFKLRKVKALNSTKPNSAEILCQKSTPYRLIVEKIPLFFLSAVLSVVTFLAQKAAGAVAKEEFFPLSSRIANAFASYVRYIGKIFYPTNLAPFYPYRSFTKAQVGIFVVLIVIISLVAIYSAKRKRYLCVGWFWYLGTLVPVIGLVQVGEQSMADRYAYVPAIGIFIIAAWGIAELLAKGRLRNVVLGTIAGLLIFTLMVCTYLQVRHWKDNLSLYEHAIEVTKDNHKMHYNYGNALRMENRFNEAIKQFKTAVLIAPGHLEAHNNLALTYFSKGRTDLAVTHWNQILKYDPDWIDALNNLAWIRATHESADFRKSKEAVKLAEKACRLTKYGNPAKLDTLAAAYALDGRFAEAVTTARKALELAKTSAQHELISQIQEHLSYYQAGKPYIESIHIVSDN
jgi:Tfp pilus assembly protein PilF